mgnify:CR=1 FL=1
MFTFAIDYFILVFVATIGVIQISASTGRLNGLLLFKAPLIARTLGLALVLGAFVWFFSNETRNVGDTSGGIDANTQALFFFLGTLAGGGLTFLVSSMVNLRMNGGEQSPESGLEALRETTYVRAVGNSLGYWCREWRTQMKRYFIG